MRTLSIVGFNMIDWSRVVELRDEVGCEDFEEVVSLFLEEVDEAMTRLFAGVDADSLAADLHFLRGSAVSLGFSEFSNRCSAAEKAVACSADDLDAIKDIYRRSKNEFLAGLKNGFSTAAKEVQITNSATVSSPVMSL